MPMIKKSITVTDQQEEWIQAQLATGNYATDSEIVREALREKQMRTEEIERIRTALIEAEAKGANELTADDVRRAVQERMRRNGEI